VIVNEPQPGGTGVPPVLSEKITRRHLPHWQLAGATYFLTWRCTAGVVLTEDERDIVLAAILHWDASRWDVLAAVVMPDHVHVLAYPLPKGDGRWDLGELIHSVKSFSAHQIARQRRQGQAAGAVGPASRRSAVGPASRRSAVGPAGRRPFSVWQDERYDRWMRDEDEIVEKWHYIVGNAVKAGLVEQAEHYRWLYQKKTGGTPVPPPPQPTGGTPVPPRPAPTQPT
jgi:REP element-mobilizing transposase RayT